MHLSEEEEREVTEARTTERLHLRPPQAEDAASYRSLLVHPTISEWLRPPPLDPFEPADGDLWLKDDQRHWEEFEFGPWVLLEQSSGAYVGRAGLRWTEVDAQPAIEVSWAIAPDRHGEGFATEAAVAAIELARERGVEEVVAMVLPANRASMRVAEKAGLPVVGRTEHAGFDHVLFRLEPASQW
jgi:ribosomal-protein-alanine N-acetyltransferase